MSFGTEVVFSLALGLVVAELLVGVRALAVAFDRAGLLLLLQGHESRRRDEIPASAACRRRTNKTTRLCTQQE